MMNKPVLELKDVSKEYEDAESIISVLCGLNFKLENNSLNLIKGVTGSGKKTLFNLITLMDVPTEGNIFLDNEILLEKSLSERSQIRRKEIGSMLRQETLIPYLTVLENIMLPMVNKDEEKAIKVMEFLNLMEKKNSLPDDISNFNKQKTAMARAMINDPLFLVAYEPSGNLDKKDTVELMGLFNQIKNRMPVIILSDDTSLKRFADNSFVLKNGKITSN